MPTIREPLNGLRELFYPLRQGFLWLREEVAGLGEQLTEVRAQLHKRSVETIRVSPLIRPPVNLYMMDWFPLSFIDLI